MNILFKAVFSFIMAVAAFGGVMYLYNFGMSTYMTEISRFGVAYASLATFVYYVWHLMPPLIAFLLGIKYIGGDH